jgi:hypothetical protein
MRARRSVVVALVSVVAFVVATASASAYSGQVFFAQASVEPAVNDANGATVYLLTPNNAPFPSKANPVATAPLYLPMYPLASSPSIAAADLNCQPTNCDHVNVVPFVSPVYPSGTITTPFGTFTGGLYKGHDHLVGVASTGGDFNVAWHVILVAFTPQALVDGAANTRILTLTQLGLDLATGDAFTISTPITFNCSIVNEKVYTQHM